MCFYPLSHFVTAPNRYPSPLSLRDISPHCGESPLDKNKGSQISSAMAGLKASTAFRPGKNKQNINLLQFMIKRIENER